MIEWLACHYAWHLIGSAMEKIQKKTVENATYKHFDSNIRLAYVKLALAHNL